MLLNAGMGIAGFLAYRLALRGPGQPQFRKFKVGGTQMTPQEACRKIVENAKEPSLNWAVNYASYGPGLPAGPELKVQCLYVLSNISRWRGPEAKEVRETLKAYAKVK